MTTVVTGKATMMRKLVLDLALAAGILAGAINVVYLASHVTVNSYTGADGQAGTVIGWQGHAPGPVQCFGLEYGNHPGPFINTDC